MTGLFRCDGCGEHCALEYKFVTVTMDSENVRLYDFTLDDIPTETFGDLASERGGDYCDECGLELLEGLVELFGGGET